MKTLYVIRHAKSSWDDDRLSDFDRPLNDRGKRDAPSMGKRLKEKNVVADLVLSSPAKRALSTAKRITIALGFDSEKIKTDRRLYHADSEMIVSLLQEVKSKHNVVLLFGHNPGLTDFANAIMTDKMFIDNIPTCGVVAFSFDVGDWKDVKRKSGKMIFFDYPKNMAD
jgi:phosphohistidine phosphatase